MRRFELFRTEDVSGSSGTGVVAQGATAPNGWAVMFWEDSVKIFPDTETMMKVHGHEGRTTLRWIDPDPSEKPERKWAKGPLPKKAGVYLLRKYSSARPVFVYVGPVPEGTFVDSLNEILLNSEDEDHTPESLLENVEEWASDCVDWTVDFGKTDPPSYFSVSEIHEGEWSLFSE